MTNIPDVIRNGDSEETYPGELKTRVRLFLGCFLPGITTAHDELHLGKVGCVLAVGERDMYHKFIHKSAARVCCVSNFHQMAALMFLCSLRFPPKFKNPHHIEEMCVCVCMYDMTFRLLCYKF